MLEHFEKQREQREAELKVRHENAKNEAVQNREEMEAARKEDLSRTQEARRKKREEEVQKSQQEALRRVLINGEVLLCVLDARDPLGCRSMALEALAREKNRRVIFVITKADLVAPQVAAQWLQVLGQVGPTVVVQAETGREGIKELLQLLGREAGAPESSPSATGQGVAGVVGVIGYPGVGKRVLCRAIRQEVRGIATWLLDSVGRLQAKEKTQDVTSALHLAVRNVQTRDDVNDVTRVAPVAVVSHLVERTQAAGLMRRFRLPAFEGAEGLMTAFAADRELKTKKGKPMGHEGIAKSVLAELPSLPGCFCAPPEAFAPVGPAESLWAAHGEARPGLAALMEAHVGVLRGRGEGPTVGALAIASRGAGPVADVDAGMALETAEKADLEKAMAGGVDVPVGSDSEDEGEESEEDGMEGMDSEVETDDEGEESEEEAQDGMDDK